MADLPPPLPPDKGKPGSKDPSQLWPKGWILPQLKSCVRNIVVASIIQLQCCRTSRRQALLCLLTIMYLSQTAWAKASDSYTRLPIPAYSCLSWDCRQNLCSKGHSVHWLWGSNLTNWRNYWPSVTESVFNAILLWLRKVTTSNFKVWRFHIYCVSSSTSASHG